MTIDKAREKSILITGASSGVGRSLVDHLKSEFDVVAVARRLERMQQYFGSDENVHCYRVDLADTDRREEKLDEILAAHGPIPYLINNAGVNLRRPIAELGLEDVGAALQVNALAPLLLLQKLLGAMEANNFGRVINVTSGAPLNCFAEYGAYSSSKAALNALTVTAAREYADYNIKINLMSPGPVRTEMAPEAPMEPSACHPTVDYLLSLGADGPTGRFFWLGYEIPLFPDLEGVEWLEGKANDKFEYVL